MWGIDSFAVLVLQGLICFFRFRKARVDNRGGLVRLRCCREIARRVNYIPLSDVFTVLRLFRVLGGVDQLAVSHLSLGLSTRRWEVKSWRKLRELEVSRAYIIVVSMAKSSVENASEVVL